ncbi:glycosyltransferase [Psychroserpens sp.]|uniref:glycosyltransferase n=1 Tax=Psychroserpens sp. TaxID=2020870 RepID=UPI001AFE5C48|nr:glycosyltransferase [Psychroserpens sp.]MBO6606954.1 glycosyltransferase [Psychroserpens sp.]MBO6630825.1 glycosyltransferase [Psychroserpens sp.]MBO6654100.1 glycosyltransferase [Psychroserpens sp.]MBO6682614.1 glycosyltransferase [Psychroserpens sp.]MBO6750726.1 glycosyltransferase [Psychroserpens sp.]
MKSNPLVSVCMITYGHEAFINKAIEGILMQQTSFNFELIIADDCSPDNTEAVVNKLLSEHSKANQVTYIRHKENLGMYENFLFALNACESTYIALCEGDDYWTDPKKLQRQVDFLEANLDYEVCFTNIKVVDTDDKLVKKQLIPSHRKTTFKQRHLPTWAPTLTRVFRNRDFSKAFPNVPGLDTIMLLYQSKYGKLRLMHDITGAYRLHEGGIYSAQTTAKQKQDVIATFLACMTLADRFLYLKYFGLMFKKLFEIKSMDNSIFKENRLVVLRAYHNYKAELSGSARFKVLLIRLILAFPYPKSSKRLNNVFLRLVDKLFIYDYLED